MIHAHIDEKKGVPLWASIGVPLLGVPIMVALLALTAPAERAPVGEAEAGVRTEQVEAHTVEQAVEVGNDCGQVPLKRG